MRGKLLAVAVLVFLSASMATPARAQLVGTDITPGSSCAGYPTGAVTMTADADTNGQSVVLICTSGGTWEVDSSGGGGGTPAGNDTEIQFNSGGSFGASSDLTFVNGQLRLGGQTGLPAPAMP